jgi:hypothetical protein
MRTVADPKNDRVGNVRHLSAAVYESFGTRRVQDPRQRSSLSRKAPPQGEKIISNPTRV